MIAPVVQTEERDRGREHKNGNICQWAVDGNMKGMSGRNGEVCCRRPTHSPHCAVPVQHTHEFSTYQYQVPVGNGTCRYGSNQVVHYNYISNSEKIRDK